VCKAKQKQQVVLPENTLKPMVGRPFTRRQTVQNLIINTKTNHFDKRPTYRPYFKQATSKPTHIADSSVIYFFPRRTRKNLISIAAAEMALLLLLQPLKPTLRQKQKSHFLAKAPN